MIRRKLYIGPWVVDFFFVTSGKQKLTILETLYNAGAPDSIIENAASILDNEKVNSGFTYSNIDNRRAIVVIGRTTNGGEFLNTFVHEIRHLVNDVAQSLGYDLRGEPPAYISGNAALELAEVLCELGCPHCHSLPENSVDYGSIGGIDF